MLRVVFVHFSADEDFVRKLLHATSMTRGHLDDDRAGRDEKLLTCVRKAVWGMLYADEIGIVSKSA